MVSKPATPRVPALTGAHQQQLRQLIAALAEHGQPANDLALLGQLADDMPRFRAGLPAGLRHALDELDTNAAALAAALAELGAAAHAFSPPGTGLPAAWLLDPARLDVWIEQTHALAQLAAEVALRAQQRAELLSRYECAAE